mgnify:CR=1 FL=1
MVTLAGYTFDFMFNENHSTGPIYFGKELEGIKASLFALQDGYLELVKNNPDIFVRCQKTSFKLKIKKIYAPGFLPWEWLFP